MHHLDFIPALLAGRRSWRYTVLHPQELNLPAYNRPAYYLLASHHSSTSNTNPFPRLCALIAYYPIPSTEQSVADSSSESCTPACSSTASIFNPAPAATFLPIQIHLPGQTDKSPTFWPWITLSPSEGDVTYRKRHRCHVYTYAEAKAGFAERNPSAYRAKDIDLHDGDQISSQLAWSRALGCLRRAFGVGSNWAVLANETVWDEYWQRLLADMERAKYGHEVTGSAMELLTGFSASDNERSSRRTSGCDEEGSSVKCIPTLAGGEFVQLMSARWQPISLCYMASVADAFQAMIQQVFGHSSRTRSFQLVRMFSIYIYCRVQ